MRSGNDRSFASGDSAGLDDREDLLKKLSFGADDPVDLEGRLQTLGRFCKENSILHLRAFGSILGDPGRPGESGSEDRDENPTFRSDSDLDLLVEFEPRTRVTLLDMARMERELTELIGRKVDLRTAGDLSPYFRQEVLSKAVEIHARSA